MNIEEVDNIILNSFGVMLYFSGTNCDVCKVLKPKVEEEFSKNFPKIKQIYLSDNDMELYAHFSVFSVPTVLVFFEGKEFFRRARNLSLISFIQEVKRPYLMLEESF